MRFWNRGTHDFCGGWNTLHYGECLPYCWFSVFPTYNSKNILGRIMVVVLKMKGNTNVKFYYIRFTFMALTFLLLLHEMISKTEYILYWSLSCLWQSDKKQKFIAEIRILRGKNKGVYNEKTSWTNHRRSLPKALEVGYHIWHQSFMFVKFSNKRM